MKLGHALDDVGESERDLVSELRDLAERHAAEHDLYHLGHTLAGQGESRLDRLAPFADRYGTHRTGPSGDTSPGPLERIQRAASRLLGRSEITGLVLLHDLRDLYLTAQANQLAWVILLQGARAVRDEQLVDVATESCEETETVARWLRTRIKETAPQVLATG
jgi:hypothetical protein